MIDTSFILHVSPLSKIREVPLYRKNNSRFLVSGMKSIDRRPKSVKVKNEKKKKLPLLANL